MIKFFVSGDNSPDSYSSIILLTVYQQITPILTRYLTKARLNLLQISHVHSSYLGPEAY